MNFYNGLINNLKEDEVFVFGSNPEGRHGAGAAKIAKIKFGAIYGKGRGLQGQSYALPTKNLTAGFEEKISARKKIVYEKAGEKSISKEQIKENIKEMYKLARKRKDLKFYIAYKNETRNLNGYSSEEMFELFTDKLQIPKNIIFSDTFKDLSIKKGLHSEANHTPDTDGINHINVYSKGKTKLGRMLTNMSDIETTINIENKEYTFKSLEAYWYYLKIKLLTGEEHLKEFLNYNCFEAKKKGKEILKKLNSEKFDFSSDIYTKEFQPLIKIALKNKINSNSELKELLFKNRLPFRHYYVYGEPENEYVVDLPQYNWILDFIKDITNELKEEISNKKRNFSITVVNKYQSDDFYYCGRGSELGNPYTHKTGTLGKFEVNSREEACEEYQKYFDTKVSKKDNVFLTPLREIYTLARKKDLELGCYCAPKQCHCENH